MVQSSVSRSLHGLCEPKEAFLQSLFTQSGKCQDNLGEQRRRRGANPMCQALPHISSQMPHMVLAPHSSQMRTLRPREARDRANVPSWDLNSPPQGQRPHLSTVSPQLLASEGF